MLQTHTLSEDVIRIAFPRQQCLRECTSKLHYTCIACIVIKCFPPGLPGVHRDDTLK